jgi:protein-disulfide isomerase
VPKEPKPRAKTNSKDGDKVTRNLVIGMVALVGTLLIVGSIWNQSSSDEAAPSPSAIEKIEPAAAGNELTPEVLSESDYAIVYNKSASPKIDIWEDFQCPFCGQFEKSMGSYLEKLIRNNEAQVGYHMVSFLGPESIRAANAAYCAVPEGRFLEFHKSLYDIQGAENSGLFSNENLIQVGQKLGITSAEFESCVNGGSNNEFVTKVADSMSKYKVDSTPTVFINGTLWRPSSNTFNVDEFIAAVEAAK